jgi:hypothetical protein
MRFAASSRVKATFVLAVSAIPFHDFVKRGPKALISGRHTSHMASRQSIDKSRGNQNRGQANECDGRLHG